MHKSFEKNEKAKKKLVFVGATAEGQKSLTKSQAWLKRHKVPWINVIGTKSHEDYKVRGFPTTMVIGVDGKVFWHDEMQGTLEKAIEEALKKA